jgi:hypothetical protein
MTNLIPEKRLDRNGKLVTKHVRATPRQSSLKPSLPAPTAGATKASPAKKAFTPRPKQAEQTYRSYRLSTFKPSDPLSNDEERERNFYQSAYSSFNASDIEMYDVFSATATQGDAVWLMCRGVRTADEARSMLKKHKAKHLIADRSALMQDALERGVSASDFMEGYNLLTPEQRASPYALDAAEFKVSSLNYNFNGFILEDIFNGNVSYADLKTIGITKLKPYSRAYALTGVLTKLNRGEADYSIEDVKAFVIRAGAAKADEEQFRAAAQFAEHHGFDLLQTTHDFESIARATSHYRSPTSGFRRDHEDDPEELTRDRIEYEFRMRRALTERRVSSGYSNQFFEAGIPVETAIEAVLGGGGLRAAQAIHDGIESSISGGWL